ncbi:cytochrome c oxidase subunit 3 [Membranihabitans marinus]|uniref:cytochrome c oxidase subunit 3 n=1 Tax=Membranihabitans marinus TaxID=1227546 RepID=UPI001F01FD29|nr:cytochrome c oxidase subunit 3 [Membranihabitans marinus]
MQANKAKNNSVHQYKFALYLGIAGLVMMFAALSSAYMVRQGAGNWLEFRLPNMFYVSTVVILLSSVSLRYCLTSFKNGKKTAYISSLLITCVLGVAFLFTQYAGWMEMYNSGIDLKGNPAGSFVYVLTFLHAFHVLGGIAVLGVALYHCLTLSFKVSKQRILRLELTSIYWHFVDILWIYLLLFFILQR